MYVTKNTGTERTYAIELLLEDIPGGGNVARADLKADATELLEGALVSKDTNGLWHLTKTAKIVAGGTNAAPRLDKNHQFKVGDFISDGQKSLEISAINTSNASYDVLTFSSGVLTTYSEGTVLYETAAADTTGSGVASVATVQDTSGDYLVCTVPIWNNPASFNGFTLKIQQAADDVLAVSLDLGVLTISLAKTTASNNNIAQIQALVSALGIAEGVNWANVVFSGTDWDNKQTGATLTTPTNVFANGVNSTIKDAKYVPHGITMNSIDLTAGNTGSGICVRGRVRESGCTSFLNAYLKSTLPLIRFV